MFIDKFCFVYELIQIKKKRPKSKWKEINDEWLREDEQVNKKLHLKCFRSEPNDAKW